MATAIMIGNQGKHMTPEEKMKKKLMESMLFWYDIKRQGCTNASMSQNPVLNDFSGNGRNGACRNFAWAGMSGIGGFVQNWNISRSNLEYSLSSDYSTLTISKIRGNNRDITGIYELGTSFIQKGEEIKFNKIKLRFTGVPAPIKIASTELRVDITISQDGVYEIPEASLVAPVTASIGYNIQFVDIPEEQSVNFIIEKLPNYPDAIVSDGIDDFVIVRNIPELTDYTLIAKRTLMVQSSSVRESMLCSNRYSGSAQDGAFVFESSKSYPSMVSSLSYGNLKQIAGDNIPELISWQTRLSYNDLVSFTPKEETKVSTAVTIFSNQFIGTQVLPFEYCKVALYSIILFDRTLSQEEIDYVKNNFMNDFPGGGYKLDYVGVVGNQGFSTDYAPHTSNTTVKIDLQFDYYSYNHSYTAIVANYASEELVCTDTNGVFGCNFGSAIGQRTILFTWLNNGYPCGESPKQLLIETGINNRGIITIGKLDTGGKGCDFQGYTMVKSDTRSVRAEGNLNILKYGSNYFTVYYTKIYGIQILEDGVLLMNFVPFMSSEGRVGFYETINNKAYFSEGEDFKSPSEYRQILKEVQL